MGAEATSGLVLTDFSRRVKRGNIVNNNNNNNNNNTVFQRQIPPALVQWLPWFFPRRYSNSAILLTTYHNLVPAFKNGAARSLTSIPMYVIPAVLNEAH
jgi:hypothetical protein